MVNPGSKDADLKNNNNNNGNNVDHESSESTTPSTSSSCDKSSKGNDFSSDEAKESEGDSCDPIDKTNDQGNLLINYPANDDTSGAASDSASPSPRIIQETKPVKHSCDICNITVNSATQLAQVYLFFNVYCTSLPYTPYSVFCKSNHRKTSVLELVILVRRGLLTHFKKVFLTNRLESMC